MTSELPLIMRVLARPARMASLDARSWDVLTRQARAAGLLGRLLDQAEKAGVAERIPPAPLRHLRWGRLAAASCDREVRYECLQIADALGRVQVPVVLLKGAAYVVGGHSPAAGRFFEDVDILVPKRALAAVESSMMLAGWAHTHLDAYDQRYYRQWMHELPPMQHIRRGTTVDIHHNLLPETGPLHPEPSAVIESARPLGDGSGLAVPCPEDLVLHSAAHLFHDGELMHGLRDLSDIHLLLQEFGDGVDYWTRLMQRAALHQLGRPLFYALYYARLLLGADVPDDVLDAVVTEHGPGPARKVLMDALFTRGLQPVHPTCGDAWTAPARFLLYVRSHWLKMPAPMLARHLARKAVMNGHEPAR